jgi:hypothetical protein
MTPESGWRCPDPIRRGAGHPRVIDMTRKCAISHRLTYRTGRRSIVELWQSGPVVYTGIIPAVR